jgi:hypothetical protein
MARHTRGPRPEPQNVAGLPPVNAQYVRQMRQGSTKAGYGTRGERKRVLRDEVIRRQLIEPGPAPDSIISQAMGRPISVEAAKMAQQFMDPVFGLSPKEAIGLAEMIQRGEPISQEMAERFGAKGELAAKGSMGDPIKAAIKPLIRRYCFEMYRTLSCRETETMRTIRLEALLVAASKMNR